MEKAMQKSSRGYERSDEQRTWLLDRINFNKRKRRMLSEIELEQLTQEQKRRSSPSLEAQKAALLATL